VERRVDRALGKGERTIAPFSQPLDQRVPVTGPALELGEQEQVEMPFHPFHT
jgi:hypothetical protein